MQSDGWVDESDELGNQELIALMSEALDVMFRRGWFVFLGKDGVTWYVQDRNRDLLFHYARGGWFYHRHPLLALVTADDWWTDHVDGRSGRRARA